MTETKQSQTAKPDENAASFDSQVQRVLACKKCGNDDITTTYHKEQYSCLYREKWDKGTNREHLHYHCKNCQYTWTGKVLKTG